MLGAWIDGVEAPIWLNVIKRVDWTEKIVKMLAFAAHTSYQKRFNKV